MYRFTPTCCNHTSDICLTALFTLTDGLSETDEQKSERVGKEVTKQNETDDDKETSSMTEKLEELTVKGANSSDDKTPKDEGDSKDKPSDSNEAQGAQS